VSGVWTFCAAVYDDTSSSNRRTLYYYFSYSRRLSIIGSLAFMFWFFFSNRTHLNLFFFQFF